MDDSQLTPGSPFLAELSPVVSGIPVRNIRIESRNCRINKFQELSEIVLIHAQFGWC